MVALRGARFKCASPQILILKVQLVTAFILVLADYFVIIPRHNVHLGVGLAH
jgi:hypothetical protein